MRISSRILAGMSSAAVLAVLATTPATALQRDEGPPPRISPSVTAAPDGSWNLDVSELAVTPAPPPPPPPPRTPTPQEIAAKRAEIAADYPNGTIPEDALCELSFARGHLLRCDADLALEEARAAGMPVSSISDSYRSLDGQIAVAASKPGLAATPGTSQHGLGLAIDVSGRMQAWLHEHGADYGWVNPRWAKSSRFEPWHFEYVGLDDDAQEAEDDAPAAEPDPRPDR